MDQPLLQQRTTHVRALSLLQRRKPMKHVRKIALAACAFSSAALLSFAWSEQSGLSLSVESAQARVGRPLTPVSVAGVARRQARRGVYGAGAYGAGAVAAGAVAVGTAAAVAATSPYGGWGSSYYNDPGYSSGSGPYAAYGYSRDDWRRRNGMVCEPGTMTKLDDGRMYRCQ